MVICDNCKFKDAGCIVQATTVANSGAACKFHSAQVMVKVAQIDEYTVSWPSGDRKITQTIKGGRILSQTTS